MTAKMANPNPKSSWCGPFVMAVCAFACALALGGEATEAGHKKLKGPIDPCVKLKDSMTHRIEDMKQINKDLETEKSAPNTLAGVFQMMQGKTYIDHEKVDKLTRARLEANDLNKLLHGMNCQTVDIDEELKKPPVLILKK
jgi:hypothetical protein